MSDSPFKNIINQACIRKGTSNNGFFSSKEKRNDQNSDTNEDRIDSDKNWNHRLIDWFRPKDRKRDVRKDEKITMRINPSFSSPNDQTTMPLHHTDPDNKLNYGEILDQEFESLDIDADGYVSLMDLQTVFRNFSHLFNPNEVIFQIFQELDLNGDRRISKEEFRTYKSHLESIEFRFDSSTSEDMFSLIFNLFDRNHDNFISSEEIRETMKNLGERLTNARFNEMMRTADLNRDGRISRNEFKRLAFQLFSISRRQQVDDQ